MISVPEDFLEDYGPLIITEKTGPAVGLIRLLYDRNCVGGAAHIVTDDFNLEDSHVDYCLSFLTSPENEWCQEDNEAARAVLEALQPMTVGERAGVIAVWENWL